MVPPVDDRVGQSHRGRTSGARVAGVVPSESPWSLPVRPVFDRVLRDGCRHRRLRPGRRRPVTRGGLAEYGIMPAVPGRACALGYGTLVVAVLPWRGESV